MSTLDWTVVVVLNLFVFGYGAIKSRGTKSDVDWFLGGRTLPFWIVGLSMFATNMDGGDYIAMNGATYEHGISRLTGLILGNTVAGLVMAWLVVPAMYRAGVYTNAEYLELRFGPAVRAISVLVQVQYRSAAIGTIAVALHLLLTTVGKTSSESAWAIILCLAALTTTYAAWGGLKTVASVDVFMSAIMICASAVLWFAVWSTVGGWAGARAIILERDGAETVTSLFHIGQGGARLGQPIFVAFGWVTIATGYYVVNHTQTMKMLGVRSLWDLRLCALVAAGMVMLSTAFTGTLGVYGRALMPGLEQADRIYPALVDRYLDTGAKGIVVAGVIAAAVSTFQGIGAALSALVTRDLYGRFLVKDASSEHYMRVSRFVTIVVVFGSFAYVPLIQLEGNMVRFFVSITSIFVTPLMTVYLVGVATRVHPATGVVGFTVGSAYGLTRYLSSTIASLPDLPIWLGDEWIAFAWSIGLTAGAMVCTSRYFPGRSTPVAVSAQAGSSLPKLRLSPFGDGDGAIPWWAQPALWSTLLLLLSLILVFYVLW